MTAPFVSVIVPHYNQRALLERCLDALEAQDYPRARFEIIVADNATPGGLGDLPARYPHVTFLHEERRGAAHARNAALARARGDAIAFTDADCLPARDWLSAGAAALDAADLAGGRIVAFAHDAAAPTPVEAFELVFAFRQRAYVETKGFAATANLFARRAAADRIGAFRHGVSEDVDWCRRGRALGFRLAFAGKAVVSHPARADWDELVRKWDRLISERWNGTDSGAMRGLVWAGLAAATALSIVPHAIEAMTAKELARAKDRVGAAGILVRIRLWRAHRMMRLLAASPGRRMQAEGAAR